MACVENIPPRNGDSEVEEGEIIDGLDELSDISSEEEFLLRQRLQVLENYNNVLERKKAKSSFVDSGKKRQDVSLHDLSEISGTDLEDIFPPVNTNTTMVKRRPIKSHHKQKKKKEVEHKDVAKSKDYKKKIRRKKKLGVKVISESSDESDDEYRNKRRKLANAVVVNRNKNDKTSLHARLQKMLRSVKPKDCLNTLRKKKVFTEDKETETDTNPNFEDVSCSPIVHLTDNILEQDKETQQAITIEPTNTLEVVETTNAVTELVDLCTDDDCTIIVPDKPEKNNIDTVNNNENCSNIQTVVEKDSDEDLEMLRQHALKTKSSKVKTDKKVEMVVENQNKPLILSEEEDSDTSELRLICLKSALLKKAIEMKQKQKLRKRLSQSSNLQDDLMNEQTELINKLESENNNTDIESVDMDIGSDGDDKGKDFSIDSDKNNYIEEIKQNIPNVDTSKEDELEDDEDLLRAKLLTSLSKNLPKLVDPSIINNIEKVTTGTSITTKSYIPEEKRIVINVGESDSEGEHEATKNLTKMHMKLSEPLDFQQKLDMFLKSTRMQVESSILPDVVQKSTSVKNSPKFVAKALNHLPKSEQIEYKNLVKRMAELEKIKEARHSSMNLISKPQAKETLKPRNVSVDTSKLEEQIALSRKKIAEESSKLLNLKEESKKLSQKYRIVATELRNIATAINLNKKEQRSVSNRLTKIRLQHQRLLNSSTTVHSKSNGLPMSHQNKIISTRLQKENDPSKEEYKNAHVLKSVKVSVANDFKDETDPNTRLSVQIDISSNKKTVKIPIKDVRVVNIQNVSSKLPNEKEDKIKEGNTSLPNVDIDGSTKRNIEETNLSYEKTERRKQFDDYESPLQALATANWEGDPNAILCPFEIDGNCKDHDCKYFHPKTQTKQ